MTRLLRSAHFMQMISSISRRSVSSLRARTSAGALSAPSPPKRRSSVIPPDAPPALSSSNPLALSPWRRKTPAPTLPPTKASIHHWNSPTRCLCLLMSVASTMSVSSLKNFARAPSASGTHDAMPSAGCVTICAKICAW